MTFVLPFKPPMVILPMCILDEVRSLPENQVSLEKDAQRVFSHKHTEIGTIDPAMVNAIKIDLTRHIAATTDSLQDEIRYSFNKELGHCKDWQARPLYMMLTRVVALLSGRVFVGRPFGRQAEWVDSAINYTGACEAA